MYLSRMRLNPRRRGTVFLIGNPQAMHAAVESCFPPADGEKERVLWRIDQHPDTVELYILSPRKPSFEHLQEQAGWQNEPSWRTLDFSPLLDHVTEGARYGFHLVANPLHTVTDPKTGRKVRKAHVTRAQMRQWLLDRADQIGVTFPVDDATGEPLVQVVGQRDLNFRRGGNSLHLRQAEFHGVLDVRDPDRFRTAITSGIGKARAYGCGLFTLVPVAKEK